MMDDTLICPSCGEVVDGIDTYKLEYPLLLAYSRLILRLQDKGDYGTITLSMLDLVSIPPTDELWASTDALGNWILELRSKRKVPRWAIAEALGA